MDRMTGLCVFLALFVAISGCLQVSGGSGREVQDAVVYRAEENKSETVVRADEANRTYEFIVRSEMNTSGITNRTVRAVEAAYKRSCQQMALIAYNYTIFRDELAGERTVSQLLNGYDKELENGTRLSSNTSVPEEVFEEYTPENVHFVVNESSGDRTVAECSPRSVRNLGLSVNRSVVLD